MQASARPEVWLSEQTLDVEAVHAMAPGSRIVYVGAKNCFQALYDSLRTVVDRHMADVVTDSWGDDGGDLLDDAGTRASVDNTLLMAAGTGVSVLFSSGDNGDEFTTLGVAAPDFPASSPWATAVGGTTLQIGAGGSRIGESGWSTALGYLCTRLLIGFDHCTSAVLDTWLPASWDGGSGRRHELPLPPARVPGRNRACGDGHPQRPGGRPDAHARGARRRHGRRPGHRPARGGDPDVPRRRRLRPVPQRGHEPVVASVRRRRGAGRPAGRFLAGLRQPGLVQDAAGSPLDVLRHRPGPKEAQSEVDYADAINASAGRVLSTGIVDYAGAETYCDGAGNCATRRVAISTALGYDDMTGLGAPRPGFVRGLAEG